MAYPVATSGESSDMARFSQIVRTVLVLSTFLVLVLVPSPAGAASHLPYTVRINVTYCTMGGVALLADVYTPVQPAPSLPLVLYVHGGGWSEGDKLEILTGTPENDALNALTAGGYVVASVNYR